VQKTSVREQNIFSEWAITADDAERRLARAMRICVGNELRKIYGRSSLNEPIPPNIAALLHRLDH
jgi:hypothetical protein